MAQPKTQIVTLRLAPSVVAVLKKEAASQDRSVSYLIQKAIDVVYLKKKTQ